MTLRASGKQIRQKGRRHLPCAMKTGEDNDTSVQSEPCTRVRDHAMRAAAGDPGGGWTPMRKRSLLPPDRFPCIRGARGK